MATSYATAADVATRLGVVFTGLQESQATALLEDVSAIMRARLPQLAANLVSGAVETILAKAVCCQLAMLGIDVATVGPAKSGETHPEYAVTIRPDAAAGLYLSDDQIATLTPPAADTRGKAFNIHPG